MTGDRFDRYNKPQVSGVFEATAGAPQDIVRSSEERNSVAKAFFKDKTLDAYNVIAVTTPGPDVLETPAARTNRLIVEVREMQSFVLDYLKKHGIDSASGEAAEEANKFLGGDFRTMLAELQQLETTLNQTIESPEYKALTSTEKKVQPTQPNMHLTPEKLEMLLNQVSSAVKKTPGGGNLTFEIYSSPTTSSIESFDTARLLELERRLADLEEALGVQRLPQLTLPAASVCETLKMLVTRLSALHPTKLDKIARRVSGLTSQIDELLLRRSQLLGKDQPAEEFRRVSELSSLLEQTKPAAAALPTVLARLKALRSLHQESAALVSRLDALETQQEELAKVVQSLENTLERVRETVVKTL